MSSARNGSFSATPAGSVPLVTSVSFLPSTTISSDDSFVLLEVDQMRKMMAGPVIVPMVAVWPGLRLKKSLPSPDMAVVASSFSGCRSCGGRFSGLKQA